MPLPPSPPARSQPTSARASSVDAVCRKSTAGQPFSCDAVLRGDQPALLRVDRMYGANWVTSTFLPGVIVDVEQATTTTLSGKEFMRSDLQTFQADRL